MRPMTHSGACRPTVIDFDGPWPKQTRRFPRPPSRRGSACVISQSTTSATPSGTRNRAGTLMRSRRFSACRPNGWPLGPAHLGKWAALLLTPCYCSSTACCVCSRSKTGLNRRPNSYAATADCLTQPAPATPIASHAGADPCGSRRRQSRARRLRNAQPGPDVTPCAIGRPWPGSHRQRGRSGLPSWHRHWRGSRSGSCANYSVAIAETQAMLYRMADSIAI